MKISAFSFSFILFCSFCFGQKNTFISYEISGGKDYTHVHNPTGDLNFSTTTLVVPGVNIAQEITKNIYIETGVRNGYNQTEFQDKTNENTRIVYYRNDIQVPLLLQLKLHFLKEKLNVSLSPGINYSIGFKEDNIRIYDPENQFGTIQSNFKKDYLMAEVGIAVHYNINRHIFVGARLRYDFGFNDNATIISDASSNSQFKFTSRGNSGLVGLSFGYRISNLWNKKK
ncbi:hypothetical protein J2X31_000838 [Flavobacterium arsenatis]|uniref:Outer membrane protein beta-barrel domain-containing protein n=1 Tax=Flavobacterium arsenatis TaxID=1484332 RepID=A0ABU1TLJ4_9FLAO|nr:hypothetical protein [Flavobacterium arsenatis]MDR6966840.1 hypothetical protein [Flavobacterium arsenatis]